MSQLKSVSWTNANPAIARNQSVGFSVARVTTIDVTNGGSWVWMFGMTNGYYLDVDAGSITTSDGWTPLSQDALFGAPITAVTLAADTIFTATYLDQFSFAVGDTIKATDIADDLTGTTINANYTVNAVTSTTVTCDDDTSSGFSVWVSGGYISRVSDTDGIPVPTVNVSIEGGTIGTGMVGAASASMVAMFEGQNPVC